MRRKGGGGLITKNETVNYLLPSVMECENVMILVVCICLSVYWAVSRVICHLGIPPTLATPRSCWKGDSWPLTERPSCLDIFPDELLEIMSSDTPEGYTVGFYRNYLNVLLSVFHFACRSLRELRHLVCITNILVF